jgi:hypothetical protein
VLASLHLRGNLPLPRLVHFRQPNKYTSQKFLCFPTRVRVGLEGVGGDP